MFSGQRSAISGQPAVRRAGKNACATVRALLVCLIALAGLAGPTRDACAADEQRSAGRSKAASSRRTPNSGDAAKIAKQLVEKAGVTKGLCSVVGCGDGTLLVAIAKGSGFLVHAIDQDDSAAAAARATVDDAGLHVTRVVVETGKIASLPYADNTIDVLLVSSPSRRTLERLPEREILRVLRPGGKAFSQSADGLETLATKPAPKAMDAWSHWQHGPDNNPLSSDEVIKAPYLTQWTAEPYYIAMPAITTVAGGRTFCAMGHIAHHVREEPWLNTLFARNGYNGMELWRRRLPRGYLVHRSAFIATDETFYMIDDDGNGCLMLDPESGKELGEIRIDEVSGEWKWMTMKDGVLYVLAGDKDRRETKVVKSRLTHWSWESLSNGYYRRQIPWGFGRTIAAYDMEEKKLLWLHEEKGLVDSRAMVMGGGKIFFYGPYSYVGCVDAKTGDLLWTNDDPRTREMVQEEARGLRSTPGFRTEPFSLYTPDVLLLAPQTNMYVVAVSTEDGRLLWHRRKVTNNPNMLYVDGRVVVGLGRNGSHVVVDPATGETLEDLRFGKRSCARLTGCPDAFFCRANPEGVVRYDRQKNKPIFNGAMRPSCNDGVIPANGMLFIGPWLCDCNLSLMGAMALCPAGDFRFDHVAKEIERLEWTEAAHSTVAPFNTSARDWPVYRGNNAHSGSSKARVSKNLVKSWEFEPRTGLAPTQATAAGGLVFIGGDDGKVRALDAATGEQRWSFLTAGPIQVPPTIWSGRAYVGSGDGYVYALEAATGRLLWRFRAAPVERRIMIYGRLCSNWPVNTGVVVEDGVAYVGAGLVDTDGTYVYALDAVSGEIKWQNNSSGHLNEENRKGVSAHGRLAVAGDKLWMAGGNVVSPATYDIQTGKCLSTGEVQGWPRSNRGEEIAVLNDRYMLLGGRLMFSAVENVINPGHFQLVGINPRPQSKMFISGKIPPAWDGDSFVYVNGPQSKIRCCDLEEIERAFGKAGTPETPVKKRWIADVAEIKDTVSLALARNAVVALCETQFAAGRTAEGPSGWAVMTLDPKDGEVIWQEALPSRPLTAGLLVDRDGQVIVVLENGKVVCFGKEKGFRLFAQKAEASSGS
ncbi:hypothetical protein AMJ85_05340 [candidate division BRC1 bacterium SM23_51]|nr:MAG: hypothetical protein AMJ85_05340 [candidate division BRC1 bacterium SM23_51]